MSAPTDCISLESNSFALHGQRSNNLDWYEFEARIDGARFGEIGGETKQRFIENLVTVLSNDQGVPLSKMEAPRFAEYVGGVESEYLGYVAFSGYKTLYFFRSGGTLKYVVLADNEGKHLAHAQLTPELRNSWLEVLNHLHTGSCHV